MRFYVNQFSKFDILYGGLTGIIIVIFWLYILFFFVFLGAFIQEQVFLKFKKVQNSERKKMKVCKFGGTSLANADQIRKVTEIILSDAKRSVVVVSAPGKRNPEDTKVTDLSS